MVIVSIRVAFLTLSKRSKNKIFIFGLFQPFRDAFRGSLGSNGYIYLYKKKILL